MHLDPNRRRLSSFLLPRETEHGVGDVLAGKLVYRPILRLRSYIPALRYRWCLALLLAGIATGAAAQPYAWNQPGPKVAAKAWVLQDHHSGQILGEQRGDERLPPASLTKLMTAYLIFHDLKAGTVRLQDVVTVDATAQGHPGARMFLRARERIKIEDLLKGMLVHSGNDATLALVEYVAGTEERFVARMNAAAAGLGMVNTRFTNSTGLQDAEHLSTARDMATLARRLMQDFPEYYPFFSLKEFSHNSIKQFNRNLLLWRMRGVDGLKTGHTRAAGYCLASSAERNGMRMIAVILGADSEKQRAEGGERLLSFGLEQYETRLVYQANAPALQLRIWKGATEFLPAGTAQDLYLTLPRGSYGKLKAEIHVPEPPIAPVERGQTIGQLQLNFDGESIGEYPVIALRQVDTGNMLHRALDQLRLWMH